MTSRISAAVRQACFLRPKIRSHEVPARHLHSLRFREGRACGDVRQSEPQWLAVSVVTRMEIDFGLALNAERARKLAPLLDDFFSVVPTVDFGLADAQASSALRASLRQQGRLIGAYDLLIAGTALARGLTMVTSNTGEFERIAGLRVENWR